MGYGIHFRKENNTTENDIYLFIFPSQRKKILFIRMVFFFFPFHPIFYSTLISSPDVFSSAWSEFVTNNRLPPTNDLVTNHHRRIYENVMHVRLRRAIACICNCVL